MEPPAGARAGLWACERADAWMMCTCLRRRAGAQAKVVPFKEAIKDYWKTLSEGRKNMEDLGRSLSLA